ncbi:MAG: hypothetical protein EOM49_11605 [Epsilonproteobacteria bacterium]|nr:hypothetical protein [Campylobacterota bacterium]
MLRVCPRYERLGRFSIICAKIGHADQYCHEADIT